MLARPADMGGYKTLDEIYAALDTIVANHSDIVSPRQSIGKTIENRDMWAIKISDNPDVDEEEPEILFTAAIHAREVITPLVLLHFMDHLTDNYGSDPEATYLVDNREIWFVFPVNPDGYYHNEVIEPGGGGMWRKNRRNNFDGTYGVDLNRNYGYKWGYDDQGSSPNTDASTYRGAGPFSEPETQNMKDFIESHEFDITIYYHSYSNLVLWPWGYDRIVTPDNAIFAAMGDSINAMNGYAPGPGWILYVVNGDSDDWGYGEQETKNKNFSMTFEVGGSSDGFWPELSRIPQLIQENLGPNLYLAGVAGSLQSLLPPAVPSIVLPALINSADYDVIWTIFDTINPAVAFELVEMQGFNTVTDPATDLDLWQNNDFVISGARSNSGPSSFYSGEDDNLARYIQTEESYMVEAGDSLRFWAWFNIEVDWDYAYVEISTDGQSFSPIEGNITTNYNPNGNNRGEGITGSSSGWTEGLFDLSDYTGQKVWIRFSYFTDGYVTEEGFYVDDIDPVAGYSSQTVLSSTIVDTSYSLTGKVNGVYYYKVRAQDAEDQWSDFSTVAQTLVSTGGTCVDSDSDGYGDPGNPGNTCPDDNCPNTFNPGQLDTDGDGLGDVCDDCPYDAENDRDGDGLCADEDNCSYIYNPGQEDSDGDGVGDTCAYWSVTLDKVTPLIDSGLIPSGEIITFDIRVTNNWDDYWPSWSFGFRVWSPDGAEWEQITGYDLDVTLDIQVEFMNYFGEPFGQGADTVSFVGSTGSGGPYGISPYLDTVAFQIEIGPIDNQFIGKTICLDSSWFPPGGTWRWMSSSGGADPSEVYPTWDGPHCFTITDNCCSWGMTGNVDYDPEDMVDLGDLTALIDYLFISFAEPPCLAEANVDGDPEGTIDLGDLTRLIDYLFISFAEPAPCPQ